MTRSVGLFDHVGDDPTEPVVLYQLPPGGSVSIEVLNPGFQNLVNNDAKAGVKSKGKLLFPADGAAYLDALIARNASSSYMSWRELRDVATITDEAKALALEIMHCPVVDACLKPGGETQGCFVAATWYGTQREPRYVPEPWTGHLSQARILFVSSNPGGEKQPATVDADRWLTADSDNELLVRSFDSAFEPGQRPGIDDATHGVDRQGKKDRAVRYWSWLWYRSQELLGREPRPGWDYAATEVVHCGTRGEEGVAAALPTCSERYLRRVLAASPAAVVLVVGDVAQGAVSECLNINLDDGGWGPGDVLGQHRVFLAVPHPNRRGTKWALEANVPASLLGACKDLLSAG